MEITHTVSYRYLCMHACKYVYVGKYVVCIYIHVCMYKLVACKINVILDESKFVLDTWLYIYACVIYAYMTHAYMQVNIFSLKRPLNVAPKPIR